MNYSYQRAEPAGCEVGQRWLWWVKLFSMLTVLLSVSVETLCPDGPPLLSEAPWTDSLPVSVPLPPSLSTLSSSLQLHRHPFSVQGPGWLETLIGACKPCIFWSHWNATALGLNITVVIWGQINQQWRGAWLSQYISFIHVDDWQHHLEVTFTHLPNTVILHHLIMLLLSPLYVWHVACMSLLEDRSLLCCWPDMFVVRLLDHFGCGAVARAVVSYEYVTSSTNKGTEHTRSWARVI